MTAPRTASLWATYIYYIPVKNYGDWIMVDAVDEIRRAEVRVPPASQIGQRARWDWSAGRRAMARWVRQRRAAIPFVSYMLVLPWADLCDDANIRSPSQTS